MTKIEAVKALRAEGCPRCGEPLLACSPAGNGDAACDRCQITVDAQTCALCGTWCVYELCDACGSRAA